MSSTFSCYQISRLGMYTSQIGLDTTSHNISNTDTTGYVRQKIVQQENKPITYGQLQVGTGVGVSTVRQIRSIFLDSMYRDENSSLEYWQEISSTVEDVEAILDVLSEDSLGTVIDEFFEGWEELAKDPENLSVREALIEYGNNFVSTVSQLAAELAQLQDDLDAQIIGTVDEINSIAEQVAQLNEKIAIAELKGHNANDYRDQRNYLLDTLSGYVEINVKEKDNGMVDVTVGGSTLVDGKNTLKMTCETNSSNGAFSTVLWETSGLEVNIKGGKLLALINARGDVNGDKGSVENGSPVESGEEEEDVDNDSETYNFTGDSDNLIPELLTCLNNMVSLMTRKINAIHSRGIGLDGSTGVTFFVKIDEDLPFEAGNIQINPELEEDAGKIAASATGDEGDVSIANEIVDFKDMEYFRNGDLKLNISDYYALIVNWIGTVGEEAQTYATNQDTLVLQVENSRESLSGVSQEEELTNMIKYQHAYNASVQVMNMIDSMMDKLINETGVVGR